MELHSSTITVWLQSGQANYRNCKWMKNTVIKYHVVNQTRIKLMQLPNAQFLSWMNYSKCHSCAAQRLIPRRPKAILMSSKGSFDVLHRRLMGHVKSLTVEAVQYSSLATHDYAYQVHPKIVNSSIWDRCTWSYGPSRVSNISVKHTSSKLPEAKVDVGNMTAIRLWRSH